MKTRKERIALTERECELLQDILVGTIEKRAELSRDQSLALKSHERQMLEDGINEVRDLHHRINLAYRKFF